MKRMRIMGLCLVAVFALGAFAASSAFALPEFGRCVPKAGTGKYSDANCTVKAAKGKGVTEFVKTIEKKKFTSAGGAGVDAAASRFQVSVISNAVRSTYRWIAC